MQPVWIAVLSLSMGQPGPPGGGPPADPEPTPRPAVAPQPINVVPSVQPPAAAGSDDKSPAAQTVTIQVPPAAPPTAPPAAPAATPPDRWALMKTLQGTYYGAVLDDNRTTISGWTEFSYTASTNDISNQPVVWNDRANKFLLNQHWIRLERSTVTSGTTEPTWGYRLDTLIGSDYRFSLMRGLLNSQLENSNGTQNLYGVDLIQFYGNVYLPTLFEGTDIRAGRLWTPFGSESLEGLSTPFVSRSYAFNWCPPFTHMGVMVSPQFTKNWSGKFMLANGNDVFFNEAQEARFVGAVTWNSLRKDVVTFGWSIGRGKFNEGSPYNPATVGLQTEPAGRNNINVFDLVWAHTFNSRLTYSTEFIYGYQYGVPANVPGGIVDENSATGQTGFAHWGSWVQYLTYQFSPRVTGITRFELFDDFEGQRTGFEGLYTAITVGAQIKPYRWLMFRPEIRYDYNAYTAPFEGKHSILTAAIDCIVRW